MRSTTRAVVLALAVATVAGWAVAQGAQQQYQQPAGMREATPPAGMQEATPPEAGQYQPVLDSADKLLGMPVQNTQGQKLGSLEDIVLEPGLNYVSYGVLSHKSKMFAIPWDVLHLSSDRQNLVLDIPEQAFDQAQGFGKDRWPDRADQRWRMRAMVEQPQSGQAWREQQYREQQQWRHQQIQPQAMNEPRRSSSGQVYGRPPQGGDWQMMPESESGRWDSQSAYGKEGFNFRRVSHLLGLNVETFATQEKVGDLKDLVLDVPQGLMAYGVVSVKNGHAPVPWSAIEVLPMDKIALIDASADMLNQVAIKGDVLSELSSPGYAQNIHNQFNREPYWAVLGFVGGPQGQKMHPMMQPVMQDPLMRYFDPQSITVISGTLQSIGAFDDPQLGIQGERLRVTTDDGQTVSVFAGPREFLREQGLTLQRNDPLQVRGSFASINGRTIFIASDIRTPQSEVQLRDEQGNPVWSTMSMQGQQRPQY